MIIEWAADRAAAVLEENARRTQENEDQHQEDVRIWNKEYDVYASMKQKFLFQMIEKSNIEFKKSFALNIQHDFY